MTIPFRRSRRGHGTDEPGTRADAQFLARLQEIETAGGGRRDVSGAHDRVWRRLVDEHPALSQTTARSPHSIPIAAGIAARLPHRAGGPIDRRAPGGWRVAMDVAAVAVLVIGLLLSARGVGIMPNGGNPNPMMTQSVAAATPTRPVATNQAGTNWQPGPGPRVTPVIDPTGGTAFAIASDDDLIYTVDARGVDESQIPAIGSTSSSGTVVSAWMRRPFGQQWRVEIAGDPVDVSVIGSAVVVITSDADQRSAITMLETDTGDTRWRANSPVRIASVSGNDDIVVAGDSASFQALDAQTGAERWTARSPVTVTSGPVVAGEQVIYTTAPGNVETLAAASGEPLWTVDTGDLAITSPPVISADTAYVIRADLRLFALDRETGAERWSTALGRAGLPPVTFSGSPHQAPTNDVGQSSPFVYDATPPVMALSGDRLIVGFTWSDGDPEASANAGTPLAFASRRYDLVSLDARTGTQQWRQDAITSGLPPESLDRSPGTILVDGDQIYSVGYATAWARSLLDGRPSWTITLSGTAVNQPVVIDGEIYVVLSQQLSVLREPGGMVGTATPDATPMARS